MFAQLIIEALTLIFPAYCANAIPVITGGGFPLDFGGKFIDGKPIFGKNKTFRGFFSGLVVGTAVGFVESIFFSYPATLGLMLSLGALFGDLTGAFIKRRLSLSPGDMLLFVDQFDFVIGAILFSFPIYLPTFPLELIITALIMTPPIHLLTNFVAYKMGLKCNPW